MLVTRLLQLGDIHYPDWPNTSLNVDLKDKHIPTIILAVSRSRAKTLLSSLISTLTNDDYDFIFQVGDLTNNGNQNAYRTCLRHLSYLVRRRYLNDTTKGCIITPGNHDVDRRIAAKHGIDAKFRPLQDMVIAEGWPAFPIAGICARENATQQPTIVAINLNTSLGCGEIRRSPAQKSGRGRSRRVEEVIDSPAIHAQALEELAECLAKQPTTVLPVLLGHHNLLPAAHARVAPYTELLNSGALRSVITKSDRPVIYLHGHIHADPIEVVADPYRSNGMLISISAPALIDGFNVIEITSDDAGRPRLCRIEKRRTCERGVTVESFIDIPLQRNAVAVDVSQSVLIRQCVLGRARQLWRAVRNQIKQAHPEQLTESDRLDAAVRELYYSQQIHVHNPREPLEHWMIENA